jgi:hypothetical protein
MNYLSRIRPTALKTLRNLNINVLASPNENGGVCTLVQSQLTRIFKVYTQPLCSRHAYSVDSYVYILPVHISLIFERAYGSERLLTSQLGVGTSNNYAYLVVDDKSKDAVIIDPANPDE